jgi:outer membrane biogenesis lipoprotein LolB
VSGRPGDGLDIRQDGWSVAYEEFREGKPFRMRLSREGVEIRLVVDQWSQ